MVPTRIDHRLCSTCKGSRRLCGLPECPILTRIKQQIGVSEKLKQIRALESPTPPSVLVGEYGYPIVRVGINLPAGEGDAKLYENPAQWWGKLNLYEIVKLRASLVYSYACARIRSANSRDTEAVQEAALSLKPVDSEVLFRKPPVFSMRFDPLLKPVGLAGEAEKMRIVDNPVVPSRVDQLVEDRVKALRALIELYEYGYDIYYLQRLLSSGTLGINRRFVPTRWAITAVDKHLGDYLLRKVREYPEIKEYEVYHSSYIGNRYTILLIPGVWSMEMIEAWLPRSVWVPGEKAQIYTIYERYSGRPTAEDGGYQAIRIAILEHLNSNRKCAAALAIREITPDYFAPVGNWQIREGVRNALKNKPLRAGNLKGALELMSSLTIIPLHEILRLSWLARSVERQRSLRSS